MGSLYYDEASKYYYEIYKEEIINNEKWVYLPKITYSIMKGNNDVEEKTFYCICDGLRKCEICDEEFIITDDYDYHICADCKHKLKGVIKHYGN